MTTAVIAEAGFQTRAILRRLIAAHCPGILVVGEAGNAAEALSLIRSLRPQLVFLDTDMPPMPGHSLFGLAGDSSLQLVLTADHEQIIDFRPQGPIWLMKPFAVRGLIDAVGAALLRTAVPGRGGSAEKGNGATFLPQRLALPSVNGLQFLDTRDIVYLEANSNYTLLYLTSRSTILVSKSLKEFEDLLPGMFIRIHHSCIINKNLVAKYIRGEGGQVQMKNGTLLAVARRKKEEFLRGMALG